MSWPNRHSISQLAPELHQPVRWLIRGLLLTLITLMFSIPALAQISGPIPPASSAILQLMTPTPYLPTGARAMSALFTGPEIEVWQAYADALPLVAPVATPTPIQVALQLSVPSGRTVSDAVSIIRLPGAERAVDILSIVTPTPTPTLPTLMPLPSMLHPPDNAADWQADEPYRFVTETGHNLGLAFKTFYDTHGGARIFGLPLTEVLVDAESDRLVQYFERVRMELPATQPELAQIELTRIGAMMAENQVGLAFTPLASTPVNDGTFFAQTGFKIHRHLFDFWKAHGGTEIFGYPVSREMIDKSDGTRRLVQYFERARLEYNPERAGQPDAVQVGQIGIWLAEQHALPAALLAPAQPIVKLSSASTTFGDSAGTYNATLAAQQLHGLVVEPGAMLSFLATLGEISEQTGYTQGGAIVNNRIVPIIAGGICQTSTTLYRAAFYAGLPIPERHAHSFYIDAFNDIISFDAAVFAPGLDLKIINDTPYPFLVTATGNQGTITVALWGQSDQRSVQVLAPKVYGHVQPGAARWMYDPDLEPNAIVQTAAPRYGMQAVLERIVTAANGTLLHQDAFFTQYDPVTEEIRYGRDVVPPEGVEIIGERPPAPTPTPSPTEEIVPDDSITEEEITPAPIDEASPTPETVPTRADPAEMVPPEEVPSVATPEMPESEVTRPPIGIARPND